MKCIVSNGNDDHKRTQAAVASYRDRGWVPHPVAGKKPVLENWTKLTGEAIGGLLDELWPTGTSRGVGLLLGAPSGGLIDVDLDSREARQVAPFILPATKMISGRESAPDSHRWFVVSDPPKTKKFADPVTRAMLVEFRSTGGQTCVPPTLLPRKSGEGTEPVVWSGGVMGEPTKADAGELGRSVAEVAAYALLARYWPGPGGRHDACLALAGALLRDGLAEYVVEHRLRMLCTLIGDDEVADRVKGVSSTANRAAADADTTGWPTLARLLGNGGDSVTRAARRWLGLGGAAAHDDSADDLLDHDRTRDVHGVTLTARFDTAKRSRIATTRAGALLHIDRIDLSAAAARAKYVAAAVAAAWPDQQTRPTDANGLVAAALLGFADDPPEPEPDNAATVGDVSDDDAYADPRPAALADMPPDVVAGAEDLLRDPDLVTRIGRDIETAGVTGERDLAALLYLVGTSVQLPRPLSAIVIGASSSGKSYTLNVVQGLFPPESKVNATDISANALYYMPPGSLHHKWVVAGERSRVESDDRAEAKRALREMLEAQCLRKLVTATGDGVPETVLVEQRGPIAFVESTTNAEIFDEDQNRSFSLFTDESPEQTRRILYRTAELAKGVTSADAGRVVQVHHALQRLIPRCDVVIPFATEVAAGYTDRRVDARRSFRHLLQLTKAVALLHFIQRGRDADGRVVATREDYRTAVRLAAGSMVVALGGLSEGAQSFYRRLNVRWKVGDWFSVGEAIRATQCPKNSAYRYMAELAGAYLVEETNSRVGRASAWCLTAGVTPATVALPVIGEGGEPAPNEPPPLLSKPRRQPPADPGLN